MPEMRTIKRPRKAVRGGKSSMSEADEFAMALAKARRAGIARRPKRSSAKTRVVLEREVTRAKKPRRVARRRAGAALIAIEREGRKAASPRPLARAARIASAKKRKATRKASSARKPMRRARARSMR
jgi:hypothetical protein